MSEIQQLCESIFARKQKSFEKTGLEVSWVNYVVEAFSPIEGESVQKQHNILATIEQQLQIAFKQQGVSVDFIVLGGLAENTQISPDDPIDVLLVYNGTDKKNGIFQEYSAGIKEIQAFEGNVINILTTLYPEVHINCDHLFAVKTTLTPISQKVNCSLNFFIGTKNYKTIGTSGFSSIAYPVKLYNRLTNSFFHNHPFENHRKIKQKNNQSSGNLKRLVRLLKHLKEDSTHSIALDGYFITSLVYRMELYSLSQPVGQILYLIMECSLYLKKVIEDPFLHSELLGPDDNLIYFLQPQQKMVTEIAKLKTEIDKLIRHLIMEIDLFTKVSVSTHP